MSTGNFFCANHRLKTTVCRKGIYSAQPACYIDKNGGGAMKVEIRIDPAYSEPRIVIQSDRMTPEIEALAHSLGDESFDHITAYSDRGVEFLPIGQVIRIYAQHQQVLAQTSAGTFVLRTRLYELESRLTPYRFVRISNSEIVNARMITGMDFSLTGTVGLYLKGDIKTYTSRRYVSRIRKLFDV